MDEEFYLWYKFDFSDIDQISHNENRYVAVKSHNNFILVWQQDSDVMGPKPNNAKLICLIDRPDLKIQQIQWIYRSDYLLLQTEAKIIIWDVFHNISHLEYEFKGKVHFCQFTSMGFQIIVDEGSFIVINKNRTQLITNRSDIFFPYEESVIVFPHHYKLDSGNLEKNSLEDHKAGWRERRRFEVASDIEINGDLYFFPQDWELPEIYLPKSFIHIFNDSGRVFVQNLGELLIIQNAEYCIVARSGDPEWEAIQVPSFPLYGFKVNSQENYYILRSATAEFRINMDQKLGLDEITNDIVDLVEFHNMPPFFYFDLGQDLAFARFNWKSGLIWYPDYLEDHLFLDIITSEGSIFQNTGRDRNMFIQVADNIDYLLDWRRGEKYPTGILYYRNIRKPENEAIEIYHVDEATTQLNEENYEDPEIVDENLTFPLIIPEWHKINLEVSYKTLYYAQEISNSQYYLLLELLSKQESAAELEYPDPPEDDSSFILYGDLQIKIKNRYIAFEGISPIWAVKENEFLAFHHIDGRLYLLDISETFTRPILEFPSSIPIYMEFLLDHYLVILTIELRNTTIQSHPYEEKDLETQFPYVVSTILNIETKRTYVRSMRFPFKLKNRKIDIKYDKEKNWFMCYLPSFTDPNEEILCIFDFTHKKYHLVNSSEQKRYWVGYTQNSPYNYYKYGEEFHVVEHPEIKREYTMRPFYIFENALVRKSDNLVISLVENMTKIDQLSTNDLYTLKGTKMLLLPFYYTQSKKPVYIDEEYAELLNSSMLTLERIEGLPRISKIKPNLLSNDFSYLHRVNQLLDNIYENRDIHNENGIVYDSIYWDRYKETIENMIKTIKRKLK